MHYYSSADEPFLGLLLIFCAPHFNFMELKLGAKRKVGAQKKFQFASYAPVYRLSVFICRRESCSVEHEQSASGTARVRRRATDAGSTEHHQWTVTGQRR